MGQTKEPPTNKSGGSIHLPYTGGELKESTAKTDEGRTTSGKSAAVSLNKRVAEKVAETTTKRTKTLSYSEGSKDIPSEKADCSGKRKLVCTSITRNEFFITMCIIGHILYMNSLHLKIL